MDWLTPAIVAAIAPIVALAGVRWGRKGDRENALIDQLQEDRDKDRKTLATIQVEIDQLRRALLRFETRDAQWSWHSERVEGQVVDLGGQPYPRPLDLRNDT